jgi:hypothetical protein
MRLHRPFSVDGTCARRPRVLEAAERWTQQDRAKLVAEFPPLKIYRLQSPGEPEIDP